MRCVFCGSTKFERREVTEVIEDGDKVLGTVKVMAKVCLDCSEPYFDAEAVRQLDEAYDRLKASAVPEPSPTPNP